jgi:hypothetical protein
VFALETAPAHGAWDGATYVPDPDYHGPDSFEFRVSDGAGGSDVGTVTIEVRPANDPPVAGAVAVATDEDAAVAITFAGSDPEGDPLTFAAAGSPAHGTWDGTSYTPAPNYHGPDSLPFLVSDGRGGSASGTVAITVLPVNDPPQASDLAVTTAQGIPVAIALAGTDADGDPLAITHAAPAHGSYAGGVYTPAPGFVGPDAFTYTVDDGNGGSATATVSITVTTTATDATPPTCTIAGHGTDAAGARFVRFGLADTGFGLASHELVNLENGVVAADSYSPGALGPINVLATAVDAAKSLTVQLGARDLAGNVGSCDPVAIVVAAGKRQDETFWKVSGTKTLISILNGDPGLTEAQIIVNRRRLPGFALAPGEERTIDVGSELRAGNGNTIVLRVSGPKGATATIRATESG